MRNSKLLGRELKHDVGHVMDDVAALLLNAADELTDDAENAVAKAATNLRHAAQALAAKTPAKAKALAAGTTKAVRAHPIASAAAALAAAAALVTLLARARKGAA
jgi:ElaB/YqjD/DUF883 family membrane-anchored ribosome-binding protein